MMSEKLWKLDGILRLLAGIFACLSAISLLQLACQQVLGKQAFDEGSLLYLVFASLSMHGSILFVTGIFLWLHRISWADAFGFSTPPLSRAIRFGLLAALVFLPVGMVLQEVSFRMLDWFHIATPPQAAVEEFDQASSWMSKAYLAFFAIILAPFAEEILFRGILYQGLKQIGYPRFALWSTALIFAVIHHSAVIFVPLLVLGLMLAWLYDKTNNLLASITAHSVFNAINVVLLLGDDLKKVFIKFTHS
jgi:membrane protease YdiL (CAAX protease family)